VSAGTELEPDPKRLRTARAMRRVGVAALFVLLGLGLAGVFDPSEDDASAGDGELALEVSFPERARAGLESTLELQVTRAAGFRAPVQISLTRDWLALFDLGSIDPEPESSTGDDERLIWSFEPPPGDELDVTVNLSLRPAVRRGESAQVTATYGATKATTSFDTSVVP
jgi:hypothetical protein